MVPKVTPPWVLFIAHEVNRTIHILLYSIPKWNLQRLTVSQPITITGGWNMFGTLPKQEGQCFPGF